MVRTNLLPLVNQSKFQMGLCLALLAVSAVIYSGRIGSLISIVLAVLSTLVVDLVLTKTRKVKLFFPSAAIVTGLIIGLVLAYQLPWYQTTLTGVIAMAGKHLLRLQGRHLFNPAGFGILASSFIFNQHVSWWGLSFQNLLPSRNLTALIGFLILLTPGLVSMVKMRRYYITLSFLVVYILLGDLLLAVFDNANPFEGLSFTALMVLLQPTTVFFGLVMLPEPMTSPHHHRMQTLYGLLVAAVATLLIIAFPGSSLDPFLGALLIGNAVFFKFRLS